MTETQTEQLEWLRDESRDKAYIAFTKRGRYNIYRYAFTIGDYSGERWDTSRMDHPLMPPFDGSCPTLEQAKQACATDYITLSRADRWLDYIHTNEPPDA